MSPKPSENGTEGDDEREEEDEQDTEEEEDDNKNNEEAEEEEEEDEPRLKYQRMGGDVPTLLSNDAASCVAVAERMIALGTHAGSVHILDFLGNQIQSESKVKSRFSSESTPPPENAPVTGADVHRNHTTHPPDPIISNTHTI